MDAAWYDSPYVGLRPARTVLAPAWVHETADDYTTGVLSHTAHTAPAASAVPPGASVRDNVQAIAANLLQALVPHEGKGK